MHETARACAVVRVRVRVRVRWCASLTTQFFAQSQVRDLESLSDRPQYEGVPKYGFSTWDAETARSISLSNARRERRGGARRGR
jgi:hypothetical protein